MTCWDLSNYAGPQGGTEDVYLPPWWEGMTEPVTIKYDFRDMGDYKNSITDDQKAAAVEALDAWSQASGGILQFVQDTEAADYEIINLGTGDLSAFGYQSEQGGKLGLGGGAVSRDSDGQLTVAGVAWMDAADNWDTTIGNGDPDGTVDYFTVAGHEVGHALGFNDSVIYNTHQDIMRGFYDSERDASSFQYAVENDTMHLGIVNQAPQEATFTVDPMVMSQLSASEVTTLLNAPRRRPPAMMP